MKNKVSKRTSLLKAVFLLVAVFAATAAAVVYLQGPARADAPDRSILTIEVSSPASGEIRVIWGTPSETDTLRSYRVSWALWGTGGFTSYEDANSDTGGNAYPDAPASSYTITGLAPGEYAVFVRARYEDYANGPFNKSAKVVVGSAQQPEEATPEPTQEPTPEPTETPTPEPTPEPTATPGAISGLTLTSLQPGRLWVSWDESDPAPTEYRLNWAQVDDPFPSWDSRDGGNLWLSRTAQDFSGLVAAGVTYKLRMRAIYKTGPNAPWSGPWSEVVTRRVRDNPPDAPTDLTVNSITDGGVALSWSAPAHNGLTGYRILRRSSAGTLETIVDDTGDLSGRYTDTTVSEDTTYHYAVMALSLDGDGAQSATVSATTLPPPQTPDTPVVEGAPAAPASLTARLDGSGGVTLSWTDPDDDAVTGYRVLRGGDAVSMRIIKEDTGSASVSYTDASPGADRTYVYAVQARNAAGLSQLSNTASVTVLAATETKEPRGVIPQITFDDPEISLRQADQAGSVSLSAPRPREAAAVTASLTDPDGGVTGTTWQWSSASTAGGTYTAISGAMSASYTPVSGDVGDYLKATASYTDSLAAGKSAEQVSDNAVVAPALLSNLGQGTGEGVQYTDTAQPFRTGSNTAGYVLSSIEINTNVEPGEPVSYLPTLKLHSGSATGTEVATLTTPSSVTGCPPPLCIPRPHTRPWLRRPPTGWSAPAVSSDNGTWPIPPPLTPEAPPAGAFPVRHKRRSRPLRPIPTSQELCTSR